MKRLALYLLMSLLFTSLFAQLTTKQQYLQRSKTQKSIGWPLTVTGILLITSGLTLKNSEWTITSVSDKTAPIIALGTTAVLGGFVLISEAKRNERKANAISFNLEIEHASKMCYATCVRTYYPAIAIRMRLK